MAQQRNPRCPPESTWTRGCSPSPPCEGFKKLTVLQLAVVAMWKEAKGARDPALALTWGLMVLPWGADPGVIPASTEGAAGARSPGFEPGSHHLGPVWPPALFKAPCASGSASVKCGQLSRPVRVQSAQSQACRTAPGQRAQRELLFLLVKRSTSLPASVSARGSHTAGTGRITSRAGLQPELGLVPIFYLPWRVGSSEVSLAPSASADLTGRGGV